MKVVHTKDVPWGEGMQRGSYFQRRKKLAGEAISCSVWELPPGKKSYPFHKHNVTEEALLVISGSAKVRIPGSDGASEQSARQGRGRTGCGEHRSQRTRVCLGFGSSPEALGA